jgi:hypothetical protein
MFVISHSIIKTFVISHSNKTFVISHSIKTFVDALTDEKRFDDAVTDDKNILMML